MLQGYAFPVSKHNRGSQQLLRSMNQGLAEIKKDGTIQVSSRFCNYKHSCLISQNTVNEKLKKKVFFGLVYNLYLICMRLKQIYTFHIVFVLSLLPTLGVTSLGLKISNNKTAGVAYTVIK